MRMRDQESSIGKVGKGGQIPLLRGGREGGKRKGEGGRAEEGGGRERGRHDPLRSPSVMS